MPGVTIHALLRVPVEKQDIGWLRQALDAAVKLELATIPPYLCAYWSIKDRTHPAARSILTVVIEEMLHMGLACNLLTAVGGTPRLARPDALPGYPSPLPGHVRPGLVVPLEGFSKATARRFMDIELPEEGPDACGVDTGLFTIGTFYDAIQRLFEALAPTLVVDRQLGAAFGLFRIESRRDFEAALNLIRRQGEGSGGSPVDTGPDDLSHYYRFAEIFHGRRFRRDPATGKWAFDGAELAFPEVWPMAAVPAEGYGPESGEAWPLVERFDAAFTKIMEQLGAAWQIGNGDALGTAIAAMTRDLSPTAIALMRLPRPDGGTYGPCFRLRQYEVAAKAAAGDVRVAPEIRSQSGP